MTKDANPNLKPQEWEFEFREHDSEELKAYETAQIAYNDKIRPYWEALGQFIDKYAELESVVNGALFTIAGVDPRVGKAVFSGTRLKGAIDFIKRILDATNRPLLKKNLEPYFAHIGHATNLRDNLAHYGALFNTTTHGFYWTNARAAHVPEKLQEIEISPDLLKDISFDVHRATVGIIFEITSEFMPQDYRERISETLRQPWRYKPPPLSPHSRTSSDNPQSRKRQRGARNPGRSPKRE